MTSGRAKKPEPIGTTRWSSALELLEGRRLCAADGDVTSWDVALIDRTLPDHAAIVRAIQPGGKVFLFDGQSESAEQILTRVATWAESTGSRLRSISLMSHGSAGRFALGRDWISKANLDETEDEWQRLGKVMADGASINLFGCNLIDRMGDGKILINRLSKVVGATVFASTDLTGRGGDWVLEASSGKLPGARTGIAASPNVFSVKKLSRWGGSLASPLGSEFLVNGTTTNVQQTHEGAQAVATDASGNFVVVWSGNGTGDTTGIFAQRYDAFGVAQGAEFRVNTTTSGIQTAPAVAMNASGAFVITWSGEGAGDTSGIFAQRYNAAGVVQGGQFLVNTTTTDVQQHPSVAIDDTGRFVISWTSGGDQDGDGTGIYARRYLANGAAAEGAFLVNFVTTNNDQDYSRVAMDADGDFVVAWASVVNVAFGWGIAAQRFTVTGAAVGGEFIVNPSILNDQYYPAIAMSSSGAFVVAWQSNGQDGGGQGVYARVYDTAGAAVTGEFRVNTTTANNQQYPSVAMDDAGNFTVAWQSDLQDASGFGIYARDYTAAGTAQSAEYLVNATTTLAQQYPSIAMDSNGDIVVAWSGNGTGDDAGVFARRYRSASAAINITQAPNLTTTEAGGTATFTVALNHQPTSNVTLTFTSSETAEGTVTSTLTFSPANWNVSQTVTITGVNEFIDDGNVGYTISTVASSSDAAYQGLSATDVSVTNTDNDTAGINVAVLAQPTTEAGGTATFSVVLTSQPLAPVTISLLSSNTNEGTITISGLTFTSEDWNIAKTVTVTGVDDFRDDGDVNYTIQTGAASSTDPTYNGMPVAEVSLSNTDDDTFGISVLPTSGLTTTEAGGEATFNVRLNSQPTSNVTITLSTSDPTEGTLLTSSLTFTSGDWDQPKPVTVRGVDDLVDDGDVDYDVITAAAVSGDTQYSGLDAANVRVRNANDDTAAFEIRWTDPPITTESGGAWTFEIRLKVQPAAAVVLSIDSLDDTEGSVDKNVYSLTTSNWHDWVPITVTGLDDALLDRYVDYILRITASSQDPAYDGLQQDLTMRNLDDDTPGITVTPTTTTSSSSPLIINESGTATFTVRLDARPTTDVTIDLILNGAGGTEGSLNVTSLTFTPDDWNTPKTVIVTGLDDDIDDGDIDFTITLDPTQSGDSNYADLDPTVIHVRTVDDDAAGIIVTPVGPIGPTGLFTTEDRDTATYTIVLNSRPTANVTIAIASSNTAEGQVDVTSLTFTPDDWDIPQTVTITGVSDNLNDGDVTFTINNQRAVSGDPQYDNRNPANVPVTNRDVPVISPSVATSPDAVDYAENDGHVPIDPSVVVDAGGVLSGATVRITVNYVRGEDVLRFDNANGISGSWDTATGRLTLSGAASVADYQAALRSVTYRNTSENPSSATRTVRFSVSDGTDSASATKSVAVLQVNDVPIGEAEDYTIRADSRLVVTAPNGVLANDSDVDNGDDDLSAVLVTPPTLGRLTLNADGSFRYVPLATASGTDTFTYRTTDGEDAGAPVTVTIEVEPAPQPEPIPPDDPVDPPVDPDLAVEEPEAPEPPEKPDKPKPPVREPTRPTKPEIGVGAQPAPVALATPPVRVQPPTISRVEPIVVVRYARIESQMLDYALEQVVIETAPKPGNPDPAEVVIAALPKWEITESLTKHLDQLGDELAAETQTASTASAVVGSAALVWVGYVVYSLRGGALLLTFLTSMPLWSTLDPLPVLEASEARAARKKKKKKRSGDPDDPEERKLRSVLG